MRMSHVRNRLSTFVAVTLLIGVTACESSPLGVPFRTMFRTIAGNYRPADLIDLPPGTPPPDGSDIRLSLGTRSTLTGRVFIPGTGIDVKLSGDWTFESGNVIIDFSPEVAGVPQRLVLRVLFLGDRIGLAGATDVNGQPLALDLAKPLPPVPDPDGGGSGRIPSF